MLRSLGRLFTRPHDQLALPLDAAPRNATELLARLRALGVTGIDRCRLTRNRAVMTVSTMALPPERPPGRILGEGVAAVPELVRLLQTEAKVL